MKGKFRVMWQGVLNRDRIIAFLVVLALAVVSVLPGPVPASGQPADHPDSAATVLAATVLADARVEPVVTVLADSQPAPAATVLARQADHNAWVEALAQHLGNDVTGNL